MADVEINVTDMSLDSYECNRGQGCVFKGGTGKIKVIKGPAKNLFEGIEVDGSYSVKAVGTRLVIREDALLGDYVIQFILKGSRERGHGYGGDGGPAEGTIKVSTG